MRIMICLIMLGSTQPVYGGCPAPTSQELQEWEQGLDKGKNSLVYEIADRLYHLPEEPWAEDHRRLLLKVLNRHQEIRYNLGKDRPVIWEGVIPKDRGHYAANMIEMAAWQEDTRFIPFIADHIGGGLLPEISLANFGEPAFETAMANLEERFDGWSNQQGAAGVFEIWLGKKTPFLLQGFKRERLRQELFRMSLATVKEARFFAINVLRHFNDREVFAHLESISRNDTFVLDGRFPVRSHAQEALNYMRTNGGGF